MSGLGERRQFSDPEIEINMVPIMNMFLVLIPFLLMSSSFLHLKAIDTSVPVRAVPDASLEQEKKSDIVVTAVIKLNYTGVDLSITSAELSEAQLSALDMKIEWSKDASDKNKQKIAVALKQIKDQYPKSTTLILSPGDDVLYEDIVTVMDAARKIEEEVLFPVVVISGEVSAS
ncbi:Biopolymer transport protein ExbD/TolR [Alteromonadaceae bacterium Bs31]|nr:Biopolymer transport protein ExbD/TolR [Alteromonadaceae bacterium Bs31]